MTTLTHSDKCIRICILGPISAGKSTCINTLFVKQYSDTKRIRTTSVPQIYTTYDSSLITTKQISEIMLSNRKKNEDIMKRTLESIIEYKDIEEMKYDVPQAIDLFPLHKDVNMTIYDTPGLNDIKTKSLYYRYIDENSYKFDVMVIIFDINSGLNTTDEKDILELAIKNIKNNHDKYDTTTELIVLMNKCDDMKYHDGQLLFSDPEHKQLYEQVKQIICNTSKRIHEKLKYHIVPISLEDAFIYRMFKADCTVKLEEKQLNKFGLNEFGKSKWNMFTLEEKQKEISKILKHVDHKDRMRTCGFQGLVEVLTEIFTIQKQYEYITDHVKYQLRRIGELDSKNITDKIYVLYVIRQDFIKISKLFEINEKNEYYNKTLTYMDKFICTIINGYLSKNIPDPISVYERKMIFESKIIKNVESKKICEKIISLFDGEIQSIAVTILKKIIKQLNDYYIHELNKRDCSVINKFAHIEQLEINKYEKIESVKFNVFSKLLLTTNIAKTSIEIHEYLKAIQQKYYLTDNKTMVEISWSVLSSYYYEIFSRLCGDDSKYFRRNVDIREVSRSPIQHLITKIDEWNDNIVTNDFVPDERCKEAIVNICILLKAKYILEENNNTQQYKYIITQLSSYVQHIIINFRYWDLICVRKLIDEQTKITKTPLELFIISLFKKQPITSISSIKLQKNQS